MPKVSDFDFMEAAHQGITELLQEYLTQEPTQKLIYRGLIGAIEMERNSAFALLLQNYDNSQNVTGVYGAIHCAASLGRGEFLTALLEKNPEIVSLAGPEGWTPLHYAAYKGRWEIAESLIENNADINVAIGSGATPLIVALQEKHEEVAELILQQPNIDVTLATERGFTAMHRAAEHGFAKIVRDLIVKGANTEAVGTNAEGEKLTPLDLADKWEEVKNLILSQRSTSLGVRNVFGVEQLSAKRQKSQDGRS